MRYRIDCECRLELAEAVREHHCELRLAPRDDDRQTLLGVEITIDPRAEVSHHLDAFGNRVDAFAVVPAHERLAVRLRAEVETRLSNPFDYAAVAVGREREWLERAVADEPRLLDFVLHRSPQTPGPEQVRTWFAEAPLFDGRRPLLEVASSAREWIAKRLEHGADAETRLSLEEVWSARRGDAADLAHALVTLIRSWGVPARYVTGYQAVEEDDEQICAALHAWTEVLVPGAGWRGLDPVHGLVVNDHYVAVAVGRDAGDVPRLKHAYQGEKHEAAPLLRLQMSRNEQ